MPLRRPTAGSFLAAARQDNRSPDLISVLPCLLWISRPRTSSLGSCSPRVWQRTTLLKRLRQKKLSELNWTLSPTTIGLKTVDLRSPSQGNWIIHPWVILEIVLLDGTITTPHLSPERASIKSSGRRYGTMPRSSTLRRSLLANCMCQNTCLSTCLHMVW